MNFQENISRIKKVIGLLTEEIDFDNITFFKTSQGSKYIRLSDGRLKRWKSYHQNTAGEDMGLHSWSDFSFFVDPKFYDSVSAFEQLSTNKGYKVALTKDKAGKLAYLIFDSGNWRPAKWEDAFPKYVENNPGLKGNVLTWEYSKEPQIGFHTVDGNFKNKSSQLSSFHIGNPVSEISNLTDEDKKLFFPSYFMNPQKDIIVYDYVEGRNTVPMSDRYNFDADKLVNAGAIFITPAMDGDPDSPTYKEWLDEDSSHLITLYNVEHSSPDSWIRKAITKKSNTSGWRDNFIGKLYDGKYNQILWSLDKLGIDPNDMVIEDNSLQENISRIREVMGLPEGLYDTSCENEGEKITLIDLLNVTKDLPVVDIPVEELKPHLLTWDGDADEVKKIKSADLQYPILIFVNDDGNLISIIDGHHRAQKAVRNKLGTIKAKIIPLNSLPKNIRRVFKHMN